MKTLEELRTEIDTIDSELIALLAKRFERVKEVAQVKRINKLPALAPARWQQVLESRIRIAEENGLGAEFISDIYNRIHDYALELESDIIL